MKISSEYLPTVLLKRLLVIFDIPKTVNIENVVFTICHTSISNLEGNNFVIKIAKVL